MQLSFFNLIYMCVFARRSRITALSHTHGSGGSTITLRNWSPVFVPPNTPEEEIDLLTCVQLC